MKGTLLTTCFCPVFHEKRGHSQFFLFVFFVKFHMLPFKVLRRQYTVTNIYIVSNKVTLKKKLTGLFQIHITSNIEVFQVPRVSLALVYFQLEKFSY